MGINAKDLKNLSRGDLLELLLAQTERVEELEQERTELKKQVETKDILIEKSGTLAEAALAINRVFQAADQAAAQYLSNVMRLYDEQLEKNAELEREYARKRGILSGEIAEDAELAEQASGAAEAVDRETAKSAELTQQEATEECEAMVQEATAKCETMVQEATAECETMVQETVAKCDTMVLETTSKCEAMLREATAMCDAIREESQIKCAEEELAVQTRCRELEQSTQVACEEMKQKAKKDAQAYLEKAYDELAKHIAANGELKTLLRSKG